MILFSVGVDVGVGGGVDVDVGVTPGVDVGVTPGVDVGVESPLEAPQTFPLTLKLVGTGLLPVQDPLKPGSELIACPAGTEPLYETLATVTFWPDCENVPFQPEEIV